MSATRGRRRHPRDPRRRGGPRASAPSPPGTGSPREPRKASTANPATTSPIPRTASTTRALVEHDRTQRSGGDRLGKRQGGHLTRRQPAKPVREQDVRNSSRHGAQPDRHHHAVRACHPIEVTDDEDRDEHQRAEREHTCHDVFDARTGLEQALAGQREHRVRSTCTEYEAPAPSASTTPGAETSGAERLSANQRDADGRERRRGHPRAAWSGAVEDQPPKPANAGAEPSARDRPNRDPGVADRRKEAQLLASHTSVDADPCGCTASARSQRQQPARAAKAASTAGVTSEDPRHGDAARGPCLRPPMQARLDSAGAARTLILARGRASRPRVRAVDAR